MNHLQEEKSNNPVISRKKQLTFDIVLVTAYLSFSIFLICMFHFKNTNKELAYSLLVGLSGITIGWLIGILSTPFSGEEKKKFSQLATAIIGFISGYLLSKVEPIIANLAKDFELINQDVTIIRLVIFITSGIFGFIYMFVYRRYYLQGKDIELSNSIKQ